MKYGKTKARRGFSLVETLFAMIIAALGSIATLNLLAFNQAQNAIEQQRAEAHEFISKRMETERGNPQPYSATLAANTSWPTVPPDVWPLPIEADLVVSVTDAATGGAPVSGSLKRVEVSVSWQPSGSANSRTQTETLITYMD